MKKRLSIFIFGVIVFSLNTPTFATTVETTTSAISTSSIIQADKFFPYYQVVDDINAEYGTNFEIEGFDDTVVLSPSEFKSALKEIASELSTFKVSATYEIPLDLSLPKSSGPYYKVVSVPLNLYFDIFVEIAYKVADNGNDLYLVQNTSEDRYYTTSYNIYGTHGYCNVQSYNDYISSDKLKLYFDLKAYCYLNVGGVVIVSDTIDDTFQIHVNAVA